MGWNMPFFKYIACLVSMLDSSLGGTSESIWECPRACIRRKAQKCGNRSSHSVRTDLGGLNLLGSYNRTALHLLILMLNHHPYLLATCFFWFWDIWINHTSKRFLTFLISWSPANFSDRYERCDWRPVSNLCNGASLEHWCHRGLHGACWEIRIGRKTRCPNKDP